MNRLFIALAVALYAYAAYATLDRGHVRDGIYKFKDARILRPHLVIMNGDLIAKDSPVNFSKDQAVSVEFNIDGHALVMLKEKTGLPEKIILTPNEFAEAGLEYVRAEESVQNLSPMNEDPG